MRYLKIVFLRPKEYLRIAFPSKARGESKIITRTYIPLPAGFNKKVIGIFCVAKQIK